MPQFEQVFGVLSPTIRGFTVSFIMLTAAIPSLFAGHLADRFGRLKIVMAGAVVFVIGTALEAGSTAIAMLLVGRALAGFGEGLYLGNLNVYGRSFLSSLCDAETSL
jgi:MFS family permease